MTVERHDPGDLYDADGTTFQVHVDDHALSRELHTALSDLRVNGSAVGAVRFDVMRRAGQAANPWEVLKNGEPCVAALATDHVVPYVVAQVSRLAFDMSRGRVALHGASASHFGRAVAIVGESEAGKSTLVTWLAHRGWQFLSDEVAVIDPVSMIVRPFWRPIGVRRPGPLDQLVGGHADGRSDILVPPSSIGDLGQAADLAAIVVPVVLEQSGARLRGMSGASALVALALNCPDLARVGLDAFERLTHLVGHVRTFALEYGDLDEAESVLRDLVTGSDRHGDLVTLRWGRQHAWAAIGGEVVVFHVSDATVHHLNQTAGLIWDHVQRMGPTAAIDELAHLTGRPRDSVMRDVRAALSEFSSAGLLSG
jgi:hypothetical protein